MAAEKEDIFNKKLKTSITNGYISCRDLLSAAKSAGINGENARSRVDDMGVKINKCQLGFFGWESGEKEIGDIPEALKDCIRKAAVDRTVTCPDLWTCAASCGVSRLKAGAAVDALDFKTRGCQLGIF